MPVHDILKILVCPACKGSLETDDGVSRLTCRPCGLVFPVREGIPVMLIEEAERLEGYGTEAPKQ
jgi:hypothetical protein